MGDDDKTRLVTRRTTTQSHGFVDETVAINTSTDSGSSQASDDGHTKLFRPRRSDVAGGATPLQGVVSVDDPNDPVVGWLVVVEGPGKGRSLPLGYGMNSIGRSADERVPLNFGDEQISRKGHAMLTYDPKGRKFYIQHGGGTNLTYLGDAPVLQPAALDGRELIVVGNTKLSFIPFCGAEFDWQD